MTAVLSFGSNLGDRLAHLAAGLEIVGMHVAVLAVSPVYETDAVGGVAQSAYLNVVAIVDTDDPEVALGAAHAAELSRGRLRSRRWGPRTLDVDVVAVGALTSLDPRLTLPHPRAHERAFVLAPWLDVDPDALVPERGLVCRLLARLGDAGVRRVGTIHGGVA